MKLLNLLFNLLITMLKLLIVLDVESVVVEALKFVDLVSIVEVVDC